MLAFVLQNTKLMMSDVLIYGRSMGTAVAVALAKEFQSQPPAALILVSPFRSLKGIVVHHLGCLFKCLLQQQFDSHSNILEVDNSCPILLIHGIKDFLIPFDNSYRIYQSLCQ